MNGYYNKSGRTFAQVALFWSVFAAAIFSGTGKVGVGQADGVTSPTKPKFTLSRETTFFTGPLDKDGYVDYATALNRHFGAAVTPEKNAYAVLLHVAGKPAINDLPQTGKVLQLLGIETIPEQSQLLFYQTYLTERLRFRLAQSSELVRQELEARRRPWQAEDYPYLAAWLRDCEEGLARLEAAAHMPYFFVPAVPSMPLMDFSAPGILWIRTAMGAWHIRAMLRVQLGLYDAAWNDCLSALRWAHLCQRSYLPLVHLIGSIYHGLANYGIWLFVCYAPVDAKRLVRYHDEWQRLSSPMVPPQHSLLATRAGLLEWVQRLHRGQEVVFPIAEDENYLKLPTPLASELKDLRGFLDWEEVMRTCNRWCDRFENACGIADLRERRKTLARLQEELKEAAFPVRAFRWPDFFCEMGLSSHKERSSKLGTTLAAEGLKLHFRIVSSYDRLELFRRFTMTVFALARYREEQGRYPERLDQLVPAFLANLEIDVFSGKPLLYRRTADGFVLYSVGPNGQDDGGRTYSEDGRSDDIVLEIPVP